MQKKTLLGLGLCTLLVCLVIGCNIAILLFASIREINSSPQQAERQKSLVFSQTQLDSIENSFGEDIDILPEYRTQILTVLAYYPDLKGVKISFEYSHEATTMASRPKLSSLLAEKRAYHILINNREDFEGILLSDVPSEAQVGVIGHEIAHIAEYERRNLLGILQLGTMYLTEKGKRSFEREMDRQTIERGLGWQLLAWAKYSMYTSPKTSEEYKAFKRRIYMAPSEILSYMQMYSSHHFK